MLNNTHLNSREHPKYHRSNRSSPAMAVSNGFPQQSNNHSYHHRQVPPPVQCSAYFISRVDLSNYTVQTLRQTIDNVVSRPKPKGLKVKLSLPDEGLIISNTLDPNQSWMYREAELLYFWRDSYYPNLIIVITMNRTNHQAIAPYSASIFRLRGKDSIQRFLQRAQRFFAELSSRNPSKTSFERSATTDNPRKRSRHHSKSRKKSQIKSSPSTQTSFDPRQLTTTDAIFKLYNARTYSETTISSDTQTSNSRQLNHHVDDDEKMTTVSNYLPTEYVAELVRELKQLRSEIAALKFETRLTPVRSTSTSPLLINLGRETSASPLEMDAETQTDFNSIDQETKIDVSASNQRKNEQSNTKVTKRTLLSTANTNGSDREDSYPSRQRPTIKPSPNDRKPTEKDSSSTPMDADSSAGEVVSFRSSLEDTIAPPENIYENLPIFIPTDSNPNIPTKDKPYFYVRVSNKSESDMKQQKYLSQLMGPHPPISLLIPTGSLENKITAPETLPHHHQYIQQVLFSDRLTNPMFNVDKELLANTIANQFGIDSNSPDLQNLIANQHLFVANKRTFANMIWPITPEEESALCSLPAANLIDISSLESNNSTRKPILKAKKSSSLPSKGRRITWDNAFD